MSTLTRLDDWKARGVISPEQHEQLAGLARGEPFSLYLDLNLLLYAGVLAFVGGLGWTVSAWSAKLGDAAVVAALSGLLGACLWYCFTRAAAWSPAQTPSPSLAFDYVLYLGCLVWGVELVYLEHRFQMFSGQWDLYLLLTAAFYFLLTYRFDNRFVLSLALSTLAGWFGLTVSRWSMHQDETYRYYAIVYSLVVSGAGTVLRDRGVKAHFFGTYMNVAANVWFWALLAGVFEQYWSWWVLGLAAACAASLHWGLSHRESAFVAYAAFYGYVGFTALLLRHVRSGTALLSYFLITGTGMLILLVQIARRGAKEQ